MIEEVALHDFRNITVAQLRLAGRNAGIVGPNGSGKTSVLEALYFLAHGRSFRTADRLALVRHGAGSALITCDLEPNSVRAAAQLAASGLKLRLRGEAAKLSSLAEVLPVQLVDPSVHMLVEEGAAHRRKILDWGVFHVEPRFAAIWGTYQRAVKQRNAALKARSWEVANALGDELVRAGEELAELRRSYYAAMKPTFEQVAGELLDQKVTLEYRQGWGESSLAEALAQALPRDRRLGTTSVGPHRGDLHLEIGARAARDVVSRGQQKLLASTLVLTQARFLAERLGRRACLLLDDPGAELDVDNLGKLLRAVARTPAQVLATSLTPNGLKGVELGRMFHVEQGQIRPML